jgi:hypothetical protein
MSIYNTGTASVTNATTAVTGVGTNWLSGGLRAGDLFSANGHVIPIASVNSNTSLTLARTWTASTLSNGAYFVQLLDDNVRTLVAVNALLAQLNGGNLTAFSALSGAADKMPYFSGAGAMALADLSAAARNLLDDLTAGAMLTTLGAAPAVRATVGGSANALALTSPVVLATGAKLRFRATSANTGAATIALNGGAAKDCRTITGAVLPSGYIRTDADTEAVYDGTYWVLDREIERGSNANGDFTRFADGRLICSKFIVQTGIATAAGSIFVSAEVNWPFPVPFVSINDVFTSAGVRTSHVVWARTRAVGNTSANVALFSAISQAGSYTIEMSANGWWY